MYLINEYSFIESKLRTSNFFAFAQLLSFIGLEGQIFNSYMFALLYDCESTNMHKLEVLSFSFEFDSDNGIRSDPDSFFGVIILVE